MHACDGQTDGQTDRQTEFSSSDRVCIACSAVKKLKQTWLLLNGVCRLGQGGGACICPTWKCYKVNKCCRNHLIDEIFMYCFQYMLSASGGLPPDSTSAPPLDPVGVFRPQWRRQDLLRGGAKLEIRSRGTHFELQGWVQQLLDDIVLWLLQYWSKELWVVDVCTNWSRRLHNTCILGCQVYSKVN